jgi:hypothetical protein
MARVTVSVKLIDPTSIVTNADADRAVAEFAPEHLYMRREQITVEERAALGPGTTRPAGSIVKRRSRGGGATTGSTLRALAGLLNAAGHARGAPPGGVETLGTQTGLQQLLALLGTLAALGLRAAEEVRQLGIALALRVPDVRLEPKNVAETSLREPNDVVVLVLRSRDRAGFPVHHGSSKDR